MESCIQVLGLIRMQANQGGGCPKGHKKARNLIKRRIAGLVYIELFQLLEGGIDSTSSTSAETFQTFPKSDSALILPL